ncbi:hypothetical protein D3C74_446050 [compost metagenome]
MRERFAVQVDAEVFFRRELHEMHAQNRMGNGLRVFFQEGARFRFFSFQIVQFKTGVDFDASFIFFGKCADFGQVGIDVFRTHRAVFVRKRIFHR